MNPKSVILLKFVKFNLKSPLGSKDQQKNLKISNMNMLIYVKLLKKES